MGRGTILANLGDGQYTIKLDFGESRLAAQILLLTGANTDLDAQIAAQQVKVNQAQAALNASNAALSAAINAYIAGNSSSNLLPAIETAKLDQVAKEEALRTETVAIGKLQSAKANNLRKIDDLNSYRASLTLNAWCADYTDAASGEVATLEIPNEPQKVLIAPGGRLPVASDGELRMRALMTPEQAYYNAAILPGWQKFKPTYRSGTIMAINGDTADVALDEAKSSAGGIADIGLANIEFDVNQTTTLTNIPIVYQDCNGTAFEVGDAVVIQFMAQNWSAPRIIGFLSNPRQCGPWFVISKTVSLPTFPPYPITPGPASTSAYFGVGGKYYPNTWKNGSNYAGDRAWIGANKKVVTWRAGGDPFMYPYVVYNDNVIDCATPDFYAWRDDVLSRGYDLNRMPVFLYQFAIAGAAIYVENGQDVLYFISHEHSSFHGGNDSTLNAKLERLHFYKKNLVTNQFTKITTKTFTNAEFVAAPPLSGRTKDGIYPGEYCIQITDCFQGPLLSFPGSGVINGAPPVWYGGYSAGLCGTCFRVSFHPSECKAVCAVYQSWQTGRLEFTISSTAFFAESGLIAAEYHPDDGRLCKLTVSNWNVASKSYTLTFSEGNIQIDNTSQPRRGFVGDLSVCYPQNSVLFTKNMTTGAVTRNFFQGAYTDTKDNPLINSSDEKNPPVLFFGGLESNVDKYRIGISGFSGSLARLVLLKDKYYALFYDTSNPALVFGGVARFISSEFTQANLEANSPVVISDFSGLGSFTPMRIGYSKS